MTDPHREARAQSFRDDCFLWVTLSHFLSADLVEELAAALVEAASGGQLHLTNLFSSTVSGGPAHLASWAISEHEQAGHFAGYLQRVIQVLAWQKDNAPALYDEDMAPNERNAARALNIAAELARIDFSTFADWRRQRTEPLPRGVDALAATIAGLVDVADPPGIGVAAAVKDTLSPIPMPLRLLALKHVGDLCADADRPALALAIYEEVAGLAKSPGADAWRELLAALSIFLLQSRAAMLRLIEGPAAAAAILNPALRSEDFEPTSLLHVNGWIDGANAETLSSDSLRMPDIARAQVLAAPQLSQSHDLESALEAWIRREFRDADRLFWAVLRRQLAFGAASESRQTKAYFGRSILDELAGSLGKHRRPDSFNLAVKLLIESGEADVAARAPWPEDLLDVYLQEAAVDAAMAHASRHPGASLERQRVLVALCNGWLVNLPPHASEIGRALLRQLAASAKLGPQSFLSQRDLAQTSLKALETVAEARSEFRALASAEVADAIVAVLGLGSPQVQWQALDTALAFVDGFQPGDLRSCVDAVLARLDIIEPSDGAWPFVRPAIGLITSSSVRALWAADPGLGRRCAATVLRYGLRSSGENVRLMFHLSDLLPYVDPTSEDSATLDNVVDDLRRRAKEINSSGVTGAINGVLAVPRLAGVDGLRDAIDGLVSILKTAPLNRQSMGLPFAYEALLQLRQQHATFMADLGLDEQQVRELVEPIKAPLVTLWEAAAVNPLVFAAFAIPPRSAPDPTIIHNWTFATLGFVETFGTPVGLDGALQRAAEHSLLHESMATGRAVRFGPEILDPVEIAAEPKLAFYAALGKRLALLATTTHLDQMTLLQVMLRRCLEFGPDGMDAGVMALALRENLVVEADQIVREGYTARVNRNRNLRLSLSPLLQSLGLLDQL